MKKAKILLTAVTIFAIAGGVLAFKAHNFTNKAVYTYNGSACNFVVLANDGTGHSVSDGTIVTAGSGTPAVADCQVATVNYSLE
jgi:hypothetical protein